LEEAARLSARTEATYALSRASSATRNGTSTLGGEVLLFEPQ
jgi:hypothetical protein